jgi:hypothetical protein
MSVDENVNPEDVQLEEKQGGGRTRRDLLKTAGIVAGAAVAGTLGSADSALAADGADLQVGRDNTEEQGNTTSITTSVGLPYTAPLEDPPAPAFKVTAPDFPWGIHGDARDYGVVGGGVLAGGGVLGLGTVGGVFSGSGVAVNLDPQAPEWDRGAIEAFKGDLAVDDAGVLWYCTSDGAPSTGWIRLSHGGSRFLATPQRFYDTRPGQPPSTGPKTKLTVGDGSTDTPRVIQIRGLLGVPSNAVGIFGTLSIVSPSAIIFASLWPDGAFPGTANILATQGGFVSTAFSVGLSPTDGAIRIGASGLTDAIIDVAGYVL